MRIIFCILLILLSLAASRASAQSIQQQEQSSWCWAACVQDVEDQSGISESQTDIVSRLYGNPIDQGATIPQVAAVLHQVGIHGSIVMRPPMTPLEIVGAFSSSRKIIALVDPMLGAMGHFVVLEAADPMGNVLVSDPFPPFTRWMPVAAVYQQYHWIGSVLIR
jgi:hypothetical protein